jgi:hypothetical protein
MVSVTVQLLSGRVLLQGLSLDPEEPIASLFRQVESCVENAPCRITTQGGKMLRKRGAVGDYGLEDRCTLTAVIGRPRHPPHPQEPQCMRHQFKHDVTTGAWHAFWGRKWNTVSYDCLDCGHPVTIGHKASVCTACKSFVHKECLEARAARGPEGPPGMTAAKNECFPCSSM